MSTRSTEERFFSFVDKSGGDDSCWLWTGAKFRRGYGQFKVEPYNVKAHRWSYAHFIGEIPEGMFVCHRCDNPSCVNPTHLFIGDHKDNMRDMKVKGRAASGDRHWHSLYPEKNPTGIRNGRYTKPDAFPCGTEMKNSKLTEEAVLEIRRRYAAGGVIQRELAKEYGVHRSAIGQVVRNEKWKHVR